MKHIGCITNLKMVSKGIGYKNYFKISKKSEIKNKIIKFLKSKGPSLLEVKIVQGSFDNLLRPKNLVKIKNYFMK